MTGSGKLSLGQSHLCQAPSLLLKVPLQHQQNTCLHLIHYVLVFYCEYHGYAPRIVSSLFIIVRHFEHRLFLKQHRHPTNWSSHFPSCHSISQAKHATVPHFSHTTLFYLNFDLARGIVDVHSIFGHSITSILLIVSSFFSLSKALFCSAFKNVSTISSLR